MHPEKRNTFNRPFLKSFFQAKSNKWILGVATVLLLGVYVYFLSFREIRVFPSSQFPFGFYTDQANGGKSEIIRQSVSDTALVLDFRLRKGFMSPYVGISFGAQGGNVINLAHYNQVRLEIAGKQVSNIDFSLFTRNPYAREKGNSKNLNFYTILEISPVKKEYNIDLNRLNVPDWWRSLNHVLPQEKITPDLKEVYNFNLGSAYTPRLNTLCSLHIYSISFVRNNSRLVILLGLIELTIIILLIIIFYLRTYLIQKQVSVTIAYKSVDVEDKRPDTEDFFDYINRNFSEHDLSLEQVAEQTGINQRKITHDIQETYGCNFKTYINRIRITESKRLLRETEWPVGEIAYKVGFGNQSHFNRVFKTLVEQSPTQYRESAR